MTRPHPIVFLVDLDNTLVDNDGIQQDLKDHLERTYGIAARDRYWAILEDLMEELVRSDWKKTGSHPVARPYVNIIDQSFVESSRRNLPDWW